MSRVRMSRERAARMAGRSADGGGIFTDEEGEAIIMAILSGHHPAPVSEHDLAAILHEMEKVRIGAVMLDLVLRGEIWICGKGDDGPIYTKAKTDGAR